MFFLKLVDILLFFTELPFFDFLLSHTGTNGNSSGTLTVLST